MKRCDTEGTSDLTVGSFLSVFFVPFPICSLTFIFVLLLLVSKPPIHNFPFASLALCCLPLSVPGDLSPNDIRRWLEITWVCDYTSTNEHHEDERLDWPLIKLRTRRTGFGRVNERLEKF